MAAGSQPDRGELQIDPFFLTLPAPTHGTRIKQLHPWRQQRGLVAYCKEHGIVVQAYSPLVQGEKLGDPTLVAVAEKYSGKTPAQILIRYCLQKGWVPLPKSDKAGRIRENASAFDFEISDEDMERLDALDER